MTPIFHLFIIFNLYTTHTSALLSGGIECIGIDSCKATNLKCRPNRPCEIICNGKSACTDSTISANGATSFHLVCIGEDSCKSGLISCGTDKCQVDCISYNIPNQKVCYDIFVHTNYATSFQCTGECPQDTLALQYTTNPTQNPTSFPILKTNDPTNSPTNMPFKSPSQNPTKYPTYSQTFNPITNNNPTNIPTNIPTYLPTNIPTISPTNNPTNIPTHLPTNIPTHLPTNIPTHLPTNIPTITPTNNPTNIPNIPSTNMPTKSPINPTISPTNIPTHLPTNIPTISPTIEPTLIPTLEPTYNPSSNPTTFPTAVPTDMPTKTPTVTDIPTSNPTIFPTINPSKTPTNYPTINPSMNPSKMPSTISPTMTDTTTTAEISNNCEAISQNISTIFTAQPDMQINAMAAQESGIYGILLTITLNHQLNIDDATNIIDMVSIIVNEGIRIIVPNNCLQSGPLEIKSVHSYVAMSINFQIFVCNNIKQNQLIDVFNINKMDILCKIIHKINNKIGINIGLNSITLKTDIENNNNLINNNNNLTKTTEIMNKNTENNDEQYYGKHGDNLQLILLIMVGTLAITSLLIACAIFALNSNKIKRYASNATHNSDMDYDHENNDKLSALGMKNIIKKRKLIRKLSSTGIEIESSSSDKSDISEVNLHRATSDLIDQTEVNLHHATSNPMSLSEVNLHIDTILDSGDIQQKCQCSCHETEILPFGRAISGDSISNSGCKENLYGNQKQCCVIQEALYRAQMKRNVYQNNDEYGYGINNPNFDDIQLDENEVIGNDESSNNSAKTYELPKHAIV